MKLKEIREIGSRGVLFTYEFGDSVYLIKTKSCLILCDTSEGLEEMNYVKKYIKDHNLTNLSMYIFNSHSDYDHIWGNYAFPDCEIISHELCRERMLERSPFDLVQYSRPEIKLKLPTITFSERLAFAESGIEFVYAPGHTVCSAICIDNIDKVIYAGDLIEAPIPYLDYLNLNQYVKTLEFIKQLDFPTLITSHSQIVEKRLIDENITYLKDVISGKYLTFTSEYLPVRHGFNLKNLLLLEFEEKVKIADYQAYKMALWDFIIRKHQLKNPRIWDLTEISYQELKDDLEEYYGKNY